MLRERVTKVVAEVRRRSVMNLRTSIGAEREPGRRDQRRGAPPLRGVRHPDPGAARRAADPAPARGRGRAPPDRPGGDEQRGQARAGDAIDVHCQVAAPDAGSRSPTTAWPAGGRADSHGLQIMRERAELIGAQLDGGDNASRRSGTVCGPGAAVHRAPPHRHGLTEQGRDRNERLDHSPDPAGGRPRADPQRAGRRLRPRGRHGRRRHCAAASRRRLTTYDELQPDVVVADLQLQDGTGLDIVRRSASGTTDRADRADDALRRRPDLRRDGGRRVGFVGKDAPATEVVKAARHAAVSPRSFVCAGLVRP